MRWHLWSLCCLSTFPYLIPPSVMIIFPRPHQSCAIYLRSICLIRLSLSPQPLCCRLTSEGVCVSLLWVVCRQQCGIRHSECQRWSKLLHKNYSGTAKRIIPVWSSQILPHHVSMPGVLRGQAKKGDVIPMGWKGRRRIDDWSNNQICLHHVECVKTHLMENWKLMCWEVSVNTDVRELGEWLKWLQDWLRAWKNLTPFTNELIVHFDSTYRIVAVIFWHSILVAVCIVSVHKTYFKTEKSECVDLAMWLCSGLTVWWIETDNTLP